MNKAKFKEFILIAFAWLFAFAMVYFVYMKAKILLNNISKQSCLIQAVLFILNHLLNNLLTFRQDVFFFKNNPVADGQFTYISNRNLQFLNSGNESRFFETYSPSIFTQKEFAIPL